jgi:hypothetical protein
MRRWAEILTALVLFAVVMTALGWGARGGVEWAFPWLVEHVGLNAIWAALILLWVTGGVLLYREKAAKAGRAAGK